MKRFVLAVLLMASTAFAVKPVDDIYSRSTLATVQLTAYEMTGQACKSMHSVKYSSLATAKKDLLRTYKIAKEGYYIRELEAGVVYLTSFSYLPGSMHQYMITYLFTDKANGGYYATHCGITGE